MSARPTRARDGWGGGWGGWASGRSAWAPLLLSAALLGAWELYADFAGVQEDLLPAPHAVAAALWNNGALVWRNFAVTAEQVVLGLALALASGFALAIAIHLFPLLRRAVYPLAVGSQAVPIPVIGVLLVFWWGFGIFPKLVVIALICFFPVVVSTVDGLAAVDPEQPKLLRTLDASRWQAFRFAELPAALPAALSGARIALAVGVIGAFIAETSTPTSEAYSGLGREIITDAGGFQTARAYAATAVLFAFAIACFYALALAERKLVPWKTRARGETT
ncbi:MAG: ABC transporter permease [Solirubrobacteraceae bacterium]|jgi:NitT/TauT family transport system permease protein/putative hydroxymethylpyrimidine transport system permease protein